MFYVICLFISPWRGHPQLHDEQLFIQIGPQGPSELILQDSLKICWLLQFSFLLLFMRERACWYWLVIILFPSFWLSIINIILCMPYLPLMQRPNLSSMSDLKAPFAPFMGNVFINRPILIFLLSWCQFFSILS